MSRASYKIVRNSVSCLILTYMVAGCGGGGGSANGAAPSNPSDATITPAAPGPSSPLSAQPPDPASSLTWIDKLYAGELQAKPVALAASLATRKLLDEPPNEQVSTEPARHAQFQIDIFCAKKLISSPGLAQIAVMDGMALASDLPILRTRLRAILDRQQNLAVASTLQEIPKCTK